MHLKNVRINLALVHPKGDSHPKGPLASDEPLWTNPSGKSVSWWTLSKELSSPLATMEGLNTVTNTYPSSPSTSPSSRLWRPAAQRIIRNQCSKLLFAKNRWLSAASEGRAHATSLVNAYLSCRQLIWLFLTLMFVLVLAFVLFGLGDDFRYMPNMDMGILKGMSGIREKACEKLTRKQVIFNGVLIFCRIFSSLLFFIL